MKNVSVVLSALALIGVLVLFGMKFSGSSSTAVDTSSQKSSAHIKIAYVDFDTLQAKDVYFNKKRVILEDKKKKMTDELQASQKKMQNDAMALQRKFQAGTLTQAEGEAGEKKLMQMQQSLQSREAAMTDELLAEQELFLSQWQQRVDSFLADYNKNKQYDYILGYSKSVKSILWAKQAYNITNEVVEGLNKMADTSK